MKIKKASPKPKRSKEKMNYDERSKPRRPQADKVKYRHMSHWLEDDDGIVIGRNEEE